MIVRALSLRSSALRVALVAVMLTALNATGAGPAVAAPGWNHEVLDSGTSTGEGISTIYWPVFSQHHVFNVGMGSGASVLRHGWYQPGYSGWAFETLDAGNSTGSASATGLWASQHHVFNEGVESGTSVLRHGWYQEGASGWQFETLDAGISTGTDTAYADYVGQQHVFTHGIGPTGGDILRHGYYDPSVGVWVFETLDQGFSGGMGLSSMVWENQLHYFSWLVGTYQGLRHGWYEPGQGWKFETLVASDPVVSGTTTVPPALHSAAIGTIDGRQNVFFSTWIGCLGCTAPTKLSSLWYHPLDGSWSSRPAPLVAGAERPNGYGSSVVEYNGHTELFDYSATWTLGGVPQPGVYHAFWDSAQWHSEVLGAPKSGGEYSARRTATATFPPYNQLHAFYAQDPPALGHFWYNPA